MGGAILTSLNGVVGSGIFALPALLFAAAGSFSPFAILRFACDPPFEHPLKLGAGFLLQGFRIGRYGRGHGCKGSEEQGRGSELVCHRFDLNQPI